MKTTRLLSFFVFIFCAGQLFSQSETHPNYKKMPIEKAIQNHKLVKAMYNQIDPGIIHTEHQAIYCAEVKFEHTTYLIYGDLEQWVDFFLMDPTSSAAASSARQTIIL